MVNTKTRPIYPREMKNKYNENNPNIIVLCKISGCRFTRNMFVT